MSRIRPTALVRRATTAVVAIVLAGFAAACGPGTTFGPCGQPGVQACAPGAQHIVECAEIAAGNWRWIVVATCRPNEHCIPAGTGARCTTGAP